MFVGVGVRRSHMRPDLAGRFTLTSKSDAGPVPRSFLVRKNTVATVGHSAVPSFAVRRCLDGPDFRLGDCLFLEMQTRSG